MIRIIHHPVHRSGVTQVTRDAAGLVLAVSAVIAMQGGGLLELAPEAGTHLASLAASLYVIGSATGLYQDAGALTRVQATARALVVLVLALPVAWGIFSLLPPGFPNRELVRAAAVVGVAAVVLRRAFLGRRGLRAGARRRVLVYGAGPAAQVVGTTLRQADPGVEIVGFVPGPNEKDVAVPEAQVLRRDETLPGIARVMGVDEIVVALTERRSGSMPLRELLDCKIVGVQVQDLATHFEQRLGQLRVDFVNAGWMIFGDGFDQALLRAAVKRGFDLLFGLLLLVLAAPVMAVTALLVKLDSRGPVFYRQERVGRDGMPFMVVKFRSMRTDAERDGQPRWASATDDRVTRVGRVIRRLRIDELPQLFNVLAGDMSLVGPRPERPYFVEQLTRQIPYFQVRHSVKPGITGWAQVRYQYGATVEDALEKLQYDLYYVKNHSLLLDLIVLFETVGVVLTGKGAR